MEMGSGFVCWEGKRVYEDVNSREGDGECVNTVLYLRNAAKFRCRLDFLRFNEVMH